MRDVVQNDIAEIIDYARKNKKGVLFIPYNDTDDNIPIVLISWEIADNLLKEAIEAIKKDRASAFEKMHEKITGLINDGNFDELKEMIDTKKYDENERDSFIEALKQFWELKPRIKE